MIHISDDERRRAFSTWLRTGSLPSVRNADGTELKFNPWHDPENGRFTFSNAGRYHGRWDGRRFTGGGGGKSGGAGASGQGWPDPPKTQRRSTGVAARNAVPSAPPSRGEGAQKPPAQRQPVARRWGDGGFTRGGGGTFNGGGATGPGWPDPKPKKHPAGASGSATSRRSSNSDSASANPNQAEHFRSVVRNGYTYQIDSRGRTRKVSGTLTVAATSTRSRTAQSQAGGVDRRPTDDGGHYIAARFNGPSEAFNHFAQDANFNRGRYRALEDQWAKAKRAGKSVTVAIFPIYSGSSSRPSTIDVRFTIDGHMESLKIPNERTEKKRGK